MTNCRGPSADLGELFRSDSKGEEDHVVLGGWECKDGTPPGKARWFGITLTARETPWLFERGHSSRTIASSEMLGTLLSVLLFSPLVPGQSPSRGRIQCKGSTDNQGNSYVVQRLMTTKHPLSCVLMQLTTSLAERDLWLSLDWIPRGSNTEADAITNNDYSLFDPALRIPVVWSELPLGLMLGLLAESSKLHAELTERKLLGPQGPRGQKRRRTKHLKTPWEG